ncbi:TetR/AcrR family transcriptional regulator [Microbacterium sp.]|uniref:TetR/AcrR family transcriptional regulator n=1 Tax=Microbacterium sp. TaxID=51671 RepID=UPI00281262D0|nr:TetR/AcrR family transcriptional regulator [Microbacterium sp.]
MARDGGSKLGRDDWARAGFEMFTESGLDAVAVERVALRIGATKGSFYWHFRDRRELVDAVLERWLAETEEIIDGVAAIDDPRARLRILFERVLAQVPHDRGELDLIHRTGDPVVMKALERVSARRIAFVSEAFVGAGFTPDAARHRAVQTYAMWLGLVQLEVALPSLLHTSPEDAARFAASTVELLDDLLPGDYRPRG